MKRISILAAFLLLAAGAKAQTYSYLTFQQTDGTQKSLTANGLKITFSGNTLTATSAEGTTTLPLTGLTKMFFASEVSGVLNPTGGQTLVTIGEGSISVLAPVGTTFVCTPLAGACSPTSASVGAEQKRSALVWSTASTSLV